MSTFTTEKLDKLVSDAASSLKKDRDREVLMRRGGINVDSQTLENIGQDLNITRERVRQIEKAALNRIREESAHNHEFSQAVNDLLEKTGGIISLKTLSDKLGLSEAQLPHAIFLVKVNPNFLFIDRNDNHSHIVSDINRYSHEQLKSLHESLVEAVKRHGKPAKFKLISRYVDGPHSEDSLMELATASAFITQLDGVWGLTFWPQVNPRSIRDKIYLVLKKSGRPLHFTEISQKISTLSANPKKVTTQAVHNELIKDNRFILIGRGIYALSEWGYRSGTVADIIEEILGEEAPLSKDEIVKRVLTRRQVKTTTIVLNLQEKPQFVRVEKGIYGLAG